MAKQKQNKNKNIWRNHCPSPFWQCSYITFLNPQIQDIRERRHRRKEEEDGPVKRRKWMLLVNRSTVSQSFLHLSTLPVSPQRLKKSNTFPDSLVARSYIVNYIWTMRLDTILLRNCWTDFFSLLDKGVSEEEASNASPLPGKTDGMLMTAAVTSQPWEPRLDVTPVCRWHQVSKPALGLLPSDFWLHEEITGFTAYTTWYYLQSKVLKFRFWFTCQVWLTTIFSSQDVALQKCLLPHRQNLPWNSHNLTSLEVCVAHTNRKWIQKKIRS